MSFERVGKGDVQVLSSGERALHWNRAEWKDITREVAAQIEPMSS